MFEYPYVLIAIIAIAIPVYSAWFFGMSHVIDSIRKRNYFQSCNKLVAGLLESSILLVSLFMVAFIALKVILGNLVGGYTPRITLQVGDKEVIFQGVSHIGTKDFFETVHRDIIDERKHGFVVYREGIGGNFEFKLENNIDDHLGIVKYGDRLYLQPYFLGGTYSGDRYVDITDDLVNDFFKLRSESDVSEYINNGDIRKNRDGEFEIPVKYRDSEVPYDILKFGGVLDGLSYKIAALHNYGLADGGCLHRGVGELVICKRDEIAANSIVNNKDKKIYLVFGAAHIFGIIGLLRASGQEVEIKDVEMIRYI